MKRKHILGEVTERELFQHLVFVPFTYLVLYFFILKLLIYARFIA